MILGGFGAFGKIPALGDFIRFNAPPSFVGPWDIWMQGALAASRTGLGDDWHGCYMSAPIWRFTLAAGVAGRDAALGVTMPSVDRVGRQFPLTLMTVTPAPPDLAERHFGAETTFATLEDIALAALEDEMTRDRLQALLARVNFAPRAYTGRAPKSAAQQLHRLSRPTIWTAHTERGPCVMFSDGLPRAVQMIRLFDPDPDARTTDPKPPENTP